MSLSALAGFAEGFVSSANAKRDRQERKDQAARDDALIAALGARPAGQTSSTAPTGDGGLSWANAGYGKAEPVNYTGGAGGDTNLLGLIDANEGGGRYDTLFGHSQNGGRFGGVDVTKMTVADALAFASPSGEYGQWVKGKVGRVATPMGRYQIVGTTLRGAVDELGIAPDTLFDAKTQDTIAGHLAKRRLSGAQSPAAKRAAMRAEWEGFKNVDDATLDAAIARFETGGGALAPRALGARPSTASIGVPQ